MANTTAGDAARVMHPVEFFRRDADLPAGVKDFRPQTGDTSAITPEPVDDETEADDELEDGRGGIPSPGLIEKIENNGPKGDGDGDHGTEQQQSKRRGGPAPD